MKNKIHHINGIRLASISAMLAIIVSAVLTTDLQLANAAPLFTGTSNALQFDGVDDYVSFGNPGALGLSTFTVEVKFKVTGTGVMTSTGVGGVEAVPLVAKGRDETGGEGNNKDLNYFLGINSSNRLVGDFEDTTGANHPITGTTTITANVWHHAALTYKPGDRVRLYLDGIQQTSSSKMKNTPRDNSLHPVSLGSALDSTGARAGFFNGVLDEVRIWNVQRSANNIKRNKDKVITSDTGLVARWGLDEGAGTVVGDTSGSNITSTIFSAPLWVHGYWNTAPVANSQSVSTAENSAVAINLVAADADNDTLTYTITTQPAKGVLSGTAPNLTYTPNAYWSGADSFKFKVNDGVVDSAIATVTITVTAVNYAPVANSQTISGLEDTDLTITLAASDLDGDPLTYSIVTGPAEGTLSGTPPNLTYTPGLHYNGADSLVFNVYDGSLYSANATVTINISSVEDTPVANSQNVTTAENEPKAITLTGSDPDNEPLTFRVTQAPSHGSISGTPPEITYTPDDYWNGVDSFVFVANDGQFDSPNGTVVITVTPVNFAPVADDQTVYTDENLPLEITVTGADPDDDPISYTIMTEPVHGTLTGTVPNFTYTPGEYWNGTDTFTFQIDDGVLSSDEATITIVVNPVNYPPVADSQAVGTFENVAKDIVLTGSDVDGDPLDFMVTLDPTRGTLSGTPPYLTYTPDHNFSGTDSFDFAVTDGYDSSEDVTVTIIVVNTNDPPVANGQSVTTAENASTAVTLTASDPNSDPLSYSITAQPGHGALSGTAPNLTYKPANYWNGADSFKFKAFDGLEYSNEATVSITVTPVNFPPVATNQSVTTAEDTAKSITLAGSDPDGDSITFSVTVQPAHGALSGTAPALTYTPAANYYGSDTFKFTTYDGSLTSTEATVTINVTAVNDAPVANNLSVTTAEDTVKGITLTGSDQENNPLTYSVTVQPSHGALSGSAPSLIYTPAANFNGSDSFKFTTFDGLLASQEGTVSITVTAVNDAPSAAGQSLATEEDTPLAITLAGADPENASLAFNVTLQPANGALSGVAPDLTYTPAASYNGSDSFKFTVNDGSLTSPEATVTINVTAVNDAPVAYDQSVSTEEDTPVNVTLTGFDPDGDSITYSVTVQPEHGTLSGTAPSLTYTPAADYDGSDSLKFTAYDGALTSLEGTITITLSTVNDAPVANNQGVSVAEDTAQAITLTGSDPDGDSITFSVSDQPAHGALSGTVPNLTYTPVAGFNGNDNFTFTANDGELTSQEGTVSITVTPVNDPPSATSQSVTTAEDTAKAITLTGTDPENDSLTFNVTVQPAHGALSGAAPALTYTPAANYNGGDSFKFTVNDGALTSPEGTVTITVTAVNDAPVAYDQGVSLEEDAPLGVTLTGLDPDGDPITYSVTVQPAHGTLSGSAPALTYTPAANYYGDDSFKFIANDGAFISSAATVTVTVTPVNDAPVAENQAVKTLENTPKAFVLNGSDADSDPITYIIATLPEHGTLSGAEPNLTYTPDQDWYGEDSFVFRTNDGAVDSSDATVRITVSMVNDVPVADDQSVATDEHVALPIVLTGSDTNNDPLNFIVTAQPVNGTLSGTPPNVTYTPSGHTNGVDTFKFKVDDGLDESAEATVTITVNPVNDPPTASDQSVATDEHVAVAITLSGSDLDGDPLDFILTSSPLYGELSGTASEITYTPTGHWYGTDSFKFKVNDGSADSGDATVMITVNPVNDAPTADDQTVNVPEDTSRAITLSGTDIDNDPLTFSVVVEPSHGTLTGTIPNLLYTPELDYSGTDTFTFRANDGTADSVEDGVVTIEVAYVNDPPAAVSQSLSTDEDTDVDAVLSGSDPNSDPLTYRIVTQPSHGSLSGTDSNRAYTPAADWNGVDTFTFVVSDGQYDSPVATVTVTVNAMNDAPVLVKNTNVSVKRGQLVTLTNAMIQVDDVDNEPVDLTYTVQQPPDNGNLMKGETTLVDGDIFTQADIDAGILKYQQVNGSDINDAFQYSVSDPGSLEPVDASSSAPATFEFSSTVVTNTYDDGSYGSLRYVVTTGALAGDTVTFDASLQGQTIRLNSPIDIDKNLTISASGIPGIVISGEGAARIFTVNTGVSAYLDHFTIANGNADNGGAILNQGALTINAMTFSSNVATGNGGAVENGSTGVLSIVNSTFSENSAGQGGALHNSGGALTLDSVTVANSTNGGGIASSAGSTALINSLLSGNLPVDCSGDITSNGYNLVENPNTCAFNAATDITNKKSGIGSLEDNGGETFTFAVPSGSLLIDAGHCSGDVAEDQIGSRRPQGVTCDIGAYEYQHPAEIAYDDNASQVVYVNALSASLPTQQWRRDDTLGIHISARSGNYAMLTFFGDRFTLRFMRGKTYGKIDVFIDNVRRAKISQKGKAATQEWSIDGLGQSLHTLKIVHSGGRQINLDSVIVRQAAATVTASDGEIVGTNYNVSYNGYWIQSGTTALSQTTKNLATIRFSGSQVGLFFSYGGGYGTLEAVIDGGAKSKINQKGKISQAVWFSPVLSAGEHTLTIRHAKGKAINVDRFIIFGSPQVAGSGTILANAEGINYSGIWQFNGTQSVSKAAKNTATLRFTGSSLTLNFLVGRAYGVMDVMVDGIRLNRIDQRKSSTQPQLLIQGLTPGAHELTIKHASGKTINLTSIDIAP